MLLLATILALTLQNAPQNQLGTIEGIVKSSTGAPIAGAHINIEARQARDSTPFSAGATTTTDGAGRFTLPDVPAGDYMIGIEHEGFGSRQNALDQMFISTVTVPAGQLVRIPDVSLAPAGAIYGRVLDADGNGLSSVAVEILRMTTDELGRKNWSVAPGRMLTDDKGAYRKTLFGSGNYYVRAVLDSGVAPLTVYYPETTERSNAAPVFLPEGSESIADIRIAAALTSEGFRISANVVLPPVDVGAPFVELVLTKRDPGDSIETSMGGASSTTSIRASSRANDGIANFELRGVHSGDYELSASARINGHSYTAKVPITIRDRDIDAVELNLHPPVEVKGRLLVEGEAQDVQFLRRSAYGGSLPSGGDAAEVVLSLIPRNPSPELANRSAIIDQTGKAFSFGDVPEGEYRILASLLIEGKPSSQFLYIADIRAGGQSVIDRGFQVGRDAVESMEVVVAKTGSIEGRIAGSEFVDRSNLPVALVLIPEAPKRNKTSLYRITSLSRNGYFQLSGIEPGNYKLLAVPQLNEPIPYRSAEFIDRYESRALSVTVQKGATSGNLQVPYLDR